MIDLDGIKKDIVNRVLVSSGKRAIHDQVMSGLDLIETLAQDEYRKVYNEKDHAELVADAAIEEINRLKQEEIKYKEKHGQLIGKIHALEKKLARYENPDYVLVPRRPSILMLSILDKAIKEANTRNAYTQDRLESIPSVAYKAMIEAVEKENG